MIKYLNFWIYQYPLGFSIDKTDHIMELVYEWLLNRKFKIFDTPFQKYSTYEKRLIDAFALAVNSLQKAEIEYTGKFGHTIGQINNIYIMRRIENFNTDCRLKKTVASTLPFLKVSRDTYNIFLQTLINRYSNLKMYMKGQMSPDLHGFYIKLKTIQIRIVWSAIKIQTIHTFSTEENMCQV